MNMYHLKKSKLSFFNKIVQTNDFATYVASG